MNKPSYPRPNRDELKKKLSAIQYDVLVNNATERPFTSEYLNHHQEGLYVDAATGQPLFTSYDKFDSHCGWPSFTQPIEENSVDYLKDTSHFMTRTEVRSSGGDLHLGHVFEDGPKEHGGLRYCINGAALRFIPLEKMEEEGYAQWLPYLEKRRNAQDG